MKTQSFATSLSSVLEHVSIHTMYWKGVSSTLVNAQRDIVNHLGFQIHQHERTGLAHGVWLNEIMESASDDEVIIFLDIDCVFLNRAIVETAIVHAAGGGVFGAAHAANHLAPEVIYAGPFFMAVSKQTWVALGKPRLTTEGKFDAAGRLTEAARNSGRDVILIYPHFCGFPKWNLAGKTGYGIGTFYEGGVFHLFESRFGYYAPVFKYVRDAVLENRQIDFVEFAAIVRRRRWNERIRFPVRYFNRRVLKRF